VWGPKASASIGTATRLRLATRLICSIVALVHVPPLHCEGPIVADAYRIANSTSYI
jgi:hypothetical protein